MTPRTPPRYNRAMQSPPFTPADIDAVLFDMDGTIIETDDANVARWGRRFARVTRSHEKAETLARRFVMAIESPGNTLFTLLDLTGLDTPVLRALIALNSGSGLPEEIPPIAGVDETVRHLAERYQLGVVSTRTVEETEFYLKALGVRECFDVIAGRDTTWRIKPHPEPVRWAARQLGVDPTRCLMVGDTTVDMRSGVRAGAWACGVLCGFGERAELERAGADVILEHTALLEEWLDGKLRSLR